jgi:hypothetical protein
MTKYYVFFRKHLYADIEHFIYEGARSKIEKELRGKGYKLCCNPFKVERLNEVKSNNLSYCYPRFKISEELHVLIQKGIMPTVT